MFWSLQSHLKLHDMAESSFFVEKIKKNRQDDLTLLKADVT